jgi:hypothetical protein
MLHAAGADPLAAMPFVLSIDVEGDQWTFFKFPLADLETLYGVKVFELNVWRSLAMHVADQLAQGRPTIVEVDAFYLPDTPGTSYRTNHVKTSIGIQALDLEERRLGYFHNAGYYELAGEDFDGVFRMSGHLTDPEYLVPYVEVAKLGARPQRCNGAVLDTSLSLLKSHLSQRPDANPFRRYAAQFPSDLAWLSGESLTLFHNYAFATLRQCGAAFELGSAYLRWLEARGEHGLDRAAGNCALIATTAKALQFKTARAVSTRKALDAAPMLDAMAQAWDETMTALDARYSS